VEDYIGSLTTKEYKAYWSKVVSGRRYAIHTWSRDRYTEQFDVAKGNAHPSTSFQVAKTREMRMANFENEWPYWSVKGCTIIVDDNSKQKSFVGVRLEI